MPEGPEIRRFAKKLSKMCSGECLEKLTILQGPYSTNSKERYSNFREKVESFQPHTVARVGCKGKWLYFRLKGPQYVAFGVHHGMEGSWCTSPKNKHNILKLDFLTKSLYFQDSRRFGTFSLLTREGFREAMGKLGPDVFSVNTEGFAEAFRTKRIQKHQLCDVLLDQRIVSGIGNYMRADIMYVARLDPKELIKDLSEDQVERLSQACSEIAWNSFRANATTCGSYESTIHRGHYDPLVYGKKKCPKGYTVETFKSKGRMVHWVPRR